jgi:type VI secretion system secreted protein Hcp
MATDAFLLFTKPTTPGNLQAVGETSDPAFKGAIELIDFSFGAENATSIGSATSGAGTGKARLNEFVIRKTTDKASGVLFQACCTGAHFPEAVLSIRKTIGTGKPSVYLVYRFSMVFCSKVEWSGPGDEGPIESVTFAYGALQVSYQSIDAATGALVGTPVLISWNQVVNTPQFPVAGA